MTRYGVCLYKASLTLSAAVPAVLAASVAVPAAASALAAGPSIFTAASVAVLASHFRRMSICSVASS